MPVLWVVMVNLNIQAIPQTVEVEHNLLIPNTCFVYPQPLETQISI